MPPAPLDSPAGAPLIVDLRQAICGLAVALGLVGVDEKQHGERVACMALACATRLGWNVERLDDLFHAGLLHDCGVSSTRVHRKLVTELDWDGVAEHCRTGERYLQDFRPLSQLAPVVRHHHTHWEALERAGLSDEIAEASNLIYLVDRVDALQAGAQAAGDRLFPDNVRATVARLSGTFFAPHLVQAFLAASAAEAFWLDLEPLALAEYVRTRENHGRPLVSSESDLRDLARIFARIVDAKSRFTYEHSLSVARLSVRLAELAGLDSGRRTRVEIAALLHDLGKLGVPDEILDKAGPLTAAERAIMHRHSYDSYRILHRIGGFEEIAAWAASHHEKLGGDGYPFGQKGDDIPFEARLISVADVFQALAQNRPYRAGMPAESIRAVLRDKAAGGDLDRRIVELVDANFATCWLAAHSG